MVFNLPRNYFRTGEECRAILSLRAVPFEKISRDVEVKMAIPQWHDLTQEEHQAIAELYTGFTSLLTARMAERLKALGLAEQKVGGTGLTEQGRKLFESR